MMRQMKTRTARVVNERTEPTIPAPKTPIRGPHEEPHEDHRECHREEHYQHRNHHKEGGHKERQWEGKKEKKKEKRKNRNPPHPYLVVLPSALMMIKFG